MDGSRGRWVVVVLAAVAAALQPRAVAAQSLSVSGNPTTMRITTATAGSQPTVVTNATTTYNVTNLSLGFRIRARLSAALPAGVTLRVNLQAPPGGTSSGWVTLTTTDQLVITNVPIGTFSNLSINYELSATTSAGVVTLNTRTVTFTLSSL